MHASLYSEIPEIGLCGESDDGASPQRSCTSCLGSDGIRTHAARCLLAASVTARRSKLPTSCRPCDQS